MYIKLKEYGWIISKLNPLVKTWLLSLEYLCFVCDNITARTLEQQKLVTQKICSIIGNFQNVTNYKISTMRINCTNVRYVIDTASVNSHADSLAKIIILQLSLYQLKFSLVLVLPRTLSSCHVMFC